ncbi:hypothetical protein ACVWZK_007497 [Bradyrhizobium sp. GM0.4]
MSERINDTALGNGHVDQLNRSFETPVLPRRDRGVCVKP